MITAKYYQNIEEQREDVAEHGKQRILDVLDEQTKEAFQEMFRAPQLSIFAKFSSNQEQFIWPAYPQQPLSRILLSSRRQAAWLRSWAVAWRSMPLNTFKVFSVVSQTTQAVGALVHVPLELTPRLDRAFSR